MSGSRDFLAERGLGGTGEAVESTAQPYDADGSSDMSRPRLLALELACGIRTQSADIKTVSRDIVSAARLFHTFLTEQSGAKKEVHVDE